MGVILSGIHFDQCRHEKQSVAELLGGESVLAWASHESEDGRNHSGGVGDREVNQRGRGACVSEPFLRTVTTYVQ